jgi:hypothetical protein
MLSDCAGPRDIPLEPAALTVIPQMPVPIEIASEENSWQPLTTR